MNKEWSNKGKVVSKINEPTDLIVIIGPPAVGKMTIGKRLSEKIGFKLLHTQMEYELVTQFFPYDTGAFHELSLEIKLMILEKVRTSSLKGLIFTFVPHFESTVGMDYFRKLISAYQETGQVSIVELTAPLDERLERNKTPFRLKHKPLKRNLVKSEAKVKELEAQMRMNTFENEEIAENVRHVKIETTGLNEEETFDFVCKKLELNY